jgi:hypothetical protein
VHFGCGFDVELGVVGVAALQVLEVAVEADAEEHAVREGVLAMVEVAVVGRHQRDPGGGGQLREAGAHELLVRRAVVLDLEEVALAAEDLAVLLGRRAGGLGVAVEQQPGHLPRQAGRERDQPLRVLGEQALRDPRLVVEAFEVAGADQAHEVLVAAVVLGQQHEVVVGLAAPGHGRAVAVVAGRDVDLAADHRPDASLQGGAVELQRTEDVAMVGDRHRRHAQGGDLSGQLRDPDGGVEQRVVAVHVEVHERALVIAAAHGLMIARPGDGRQHDPRLPETTVRCRLSSRSFDPISRLESTAFHRKCSGLPASFPIDQGTEIQEITSKTRGKTFQVQLGRS